MPKRKWPTAVVLIVLYLVTWVGGWIAHARDIQGQAKINMEKSGDTLLVFCYLGPAAFLGLQEAAQNALQMTHERLIAQRTPGPRMLAQFFAEEVGSGRR